MTILLQFNTYLYRWKETLLHNMAKLNLFFSGVTWCQMIPAESSVTKGFQAYWLLLQLLIHTFFSLMSYCEPGRLNRQALPPSYSPTFYSHIKCPKENASRGFISRFMES